MKNVVANFTQKTLGLACVASLALPLLSGYAQPPPASNLGSPAPGQTVSPAPAPVSPAVAEVVRLAESGVAEDIVMAYIQNSPAGFNLSADQILYVRDLGLTSQVITAMLNRDALLRSQPQPAQPAPEPEPEPVPAPTVPVEAPLTPPPTEVAAPPPQVNYFYSGLAPYGSWVDLDGVGWCWQPSAVVVNRGWRPYCDGGHWVYTDAGWFWQSDYSWGWAPFHYGRWQLHPRCGWVWAPDTVWGPSWVVWRNQGDYCGWAPLPPRAVFEVGFGWRFNGVHVGLDFDFGLRPDHFTFIGLHDFNERDLRHHRLPATEVTRIYNHTTIINNYTVNKTTIVNRGLPVERVASVAGTPVHRATVRDLPAGSGRAVTARTATERGEAVVCRPQLTAPARIAPVSVQKVDDRHPVIQHTPAVAVARQGRSNFDRSATVPATGAHRTQPESARTVPRQNVERPASPSSAQPAPRTYQTTPRTSEPAPRTQTTPRTVQPSGRISSSSPTETGAPAHPAQLPARSSYAEAQPANRGVERSPRRYVEQPDTRSANLHTYYPKTYHQAEETRSAPARESRQASPPPAQQGNSPGSKSKKGDF